MKILFVCTGNTCRSPMAAAYFAALCRRAGRTDIETLSAGICGVTGSPASEPAKKVMLEAGLELDTFRSSALTKQMIEEANLIVAMTAGHLAHIAAMEPDAVTKSRTLLKGGDIADPFGGDYAAYRSCFEQMKEALENLFLDLKNSINR